MSPSLRIVLHAELTPEQQRQAARIYLDERNWGLVLEKDFLARGYASASPSEKEEIILADARRRDKIFPDGQFVLLSQENGSWQAAGSIHTVIANEKKLAESFSQPDSWNYFTNQGRLSSGNYDHFGGRWACFAIQTDPDFHREQNLKPADIILKGVKIVAFGLEPKKEFGELAALVNFSPEITPKIGSYSTRTINPLTRLSGLSRFRQAAYPEVTAEDYARGLERLLKEKKGKPENAFEQELTVLAKTCALRYHLSRGASLERVIPQFRVNDAASLGYGASVLYEKIV